MACLSRITDETYVQHFGNGRNKFYVEFRCNLPCISGTDLCLKCTDKSATCKTQTSRRFQHGKVNEPIPDTSHLFGGKWYEQSVKKYGLPADDIIQFAMDHQRDARKGLESISSQTIVKEEEKEVEKAVKSKKVPKINPYSSLIQQTSPVVYKEVSLPTHIEKQIEEVDLDDYDIEFVTLKTFELNGTSYFRDYQKNKLYKNIKNKIGDYVGRYNPNDENIHTDIPDSDDEE